MATRVHDEPRVPATNFLVTSAVLLHLPSGTLQGVGDADMDMAGNGVLRSGGARVRLPGQRV